MYKERWSGRTNNYPKYIKYLGYPTYANKQQLDVFIDDELIGKIRAQVNFLKERKSQFMVKQI
jgi:hypothetical protein